MGKRELWRQIAYVPQARQVSSAYTVEEMVLFGRSSRFGPFSLPGKGDLQKVDEVLERLRLTHLRSKSCARISGGELQMVLIARALAAEPRLLVLDEPESNLDFKNQLLVLDTISTLAAEGLACLFNTHYPAHALRRATHALLLSRDGTYLYGSTPRIVTEENIGRCFGVQAVIGEVETPGNVYADVVPIAIDPAPAQPSADPDRRVVACLSIILPDRSQSGRINALIHQASPWIVGRMGMPHPEAGVYLINLVLDGPWSEVSRLTGAINLVPGISAKATYAKEVSHD